MGLSLRVLQEWTVCVANNLNDGRLCVVTRNAPAHHHRLPAARWNAHGTTASAWTRSVVPAPLRSSLLRVLPERGRHYLHPGFVCCITRGVSFISWFCVHLFAAGLRNTAFIPLPTLRSLPTIRLVGVRVLPARFSGAADGVAVGSLDLVLVLVWFRFCVDAVAIYTAHCLFSAITIPRGRFYRGVVTLAGASLAASSAGRRCAGVLLACVVSFSTHCVLRRFFCGRHAGLPSAARVPCHMLTPLITLAGVSRRLTYLLFRSSNHACYSCWHFLVPGAALFPWARDVAASRHCLAACLLRFISHHYCLLPLPPPPFFCSAILPAAATHLLTPLLHTVPSGGGERFTCLPCTPLPLHHDTCRCWCHTYLPGLLRTFSH